MGIVEVALMLFLIANPIGGVPAFVSLVKDFDFRRQRAILVRESVLSMALAYAFLFIGEPFVHYMRVESFAIQLGGGVLIFLIAARMIFPVHHETKGTKLSSEPFIVPIATPLISGGGVFATIVVLSKQASLMTMCAGIFLAWSVVIAVVVASAYFQKLLGKRGLIALEQLMGMLLMMLSIELFLDGLRLFMTRVHGV